MFNLIYMGVSFATLTLFGLSFIQKKYLNLMIYGMMITQFRLLFRMFDFEKTRAVKNNEYWIQIV